MRVLMKIHVSLVAPATKIPMVDVLVREEDGEVHVNDALPEHHVVSLKEHDVRGALTDAHLKASASPDIAVDRMRNRYTGDAVNLRQPLTEVLGGGHGSSDGQ